MATGKLSVTRMPEYTEPKPPLPRSQLGGVQVIAGRRAQVGKRVDFGQEHPSFQDVGVETVSGGAAVGARVVPGAVPKAGAEAAAGAEGRGPVGGRLGALPGLEAEGGARRVRQLRGGGRPEGLVWQRCRTGSV